MRNGAKNGLAKTAIDSCTIHIHTAHGAYTHTLILFARMTVSPTSNSSDDFNGEFITSQCTFVAFIGFQFL